MVRPPTPWGMILALWSAGLGAAAQYGKVSVIFDLLARAYPDVGPALAWAVSLVGLVGILFGVVAGLIVARIRYRRALVWALWLGAAASFAQVALPPLPWFLALRVLEGVSHLAIVVAAPTLIAGLAAERDRGLALTLWGTFFGVAFALLAFAGRPLAETFGVPALFAFHAAYMAGFAILLSLRLRGLPEEEPLPKRQNVLAEHWAIYRSPETAAPAAGWLFYTFSFVSLLTVLPPFIAPEYRTTVMTAMPLMSILSSMTLGVLLLRRLSGVGVVQLGFITSACGMIWLCWSPGDPLACLAVAAAMGLIQGASFAAVPQLNQTPAAQARANGALAQMGNIGNTTGTPVLAAGLASFGYAALPFLAGGAFILGFVAHALYARARKEARAGAPS
ncbi:MAG: MFS transporter [Pseudomonadota bacterium]